VAPLVGDDHAGEVDRQESAPSEHAREGEHCEAAGLDQQHVQAFAEPDAGDDPAEQSARFKELMSLTDSLTPIDGPATAEPVEYKSSDEDSTRAHVRSWIEAIRTGGKPLEDVRFGHHAALVGHMCNLSYKSGKLVRWNKTAGKVEV
jgi:hypothetical protein